VCHPPAGHPLLGGPIITGAGQVAEPQDTIETQPSDKAVGGSGVPVTSTTVAAGAFMQAASGGGSSASGVLPGGATNVTSEEVATDDPASSAGPSGGACFSRETADGSTMEPEVILGHPTLRSPGDVSLDKAMGAAPWVLTHA
jgi:hypothetical protein